MNAKINSSFSENFSEIKNTVAAAAAQSKAARSALHDALESSPHLIDTLAARTARAQLREQAVKTAAQKYAEATANHAALAERAALAEARTQTGTDEDHWKAHVNWNVEGLTKIAAHAQKYATSSFDERKKLESPTIISDRFTEKWPLEMAAKKNELIVSLRCTAQEASAAAARAAAIIPADEIAKAESIITEAKKILEDQVATADHFFNIWHTALDLIPPAGKSAFIFNSIAPHLGKIAHGAKEHEAKLQSACHQTAHDIVTAEKALALLHLQKTVECPTRAAAQEAEAMIKELEEATPSSFSKLINSAEAIITKTEAVTLVAKKAIEEKRAIVVDLAQISKKQKLDAKNLTTYQEAAKKNEHDLKNVFTGLAEALPLSESSKNFFISTKVAEIKSPSSDLINPDRRTAEDYLKHARASYEVAAASPK